MEYFLYHAVFACPLFGNVTLCRKTPFIKPLGRVFRVAALGNSPSEGYARLRDYLLSISTVSSCL